MQPGSPFFNLYSHHLVRVAVAVPRLRVADPAYNAAESIAVIEQAEARRAILCVCPELGLSGYSCDDLFHQRALSSAVEAALHQVVQASRAWRLVVVVGLPLAVEGRLYNCAVVIHRGRILGVVPKTYLPNYREYYEGRHFSPGQECRATRITVGSQHDIPFGSRLLFAPSEVPLLRFHVEICEDLWVPVPPSSVAALAGATLLLNLSASNITVGKAEYRHLLVSSQSARCVAGYLYAAAGPGESTTDLAWDGQALIYENGSLLAETRRFGPSPQLVCSEIDLERLEQERLRQNSFAANGRELAGLGSHETVSFSLELPSESVLLPERLWERFPYVPAHSAPRGERCAEVFQIQVQGLAQRLLAAHLERVVIGVSGGLDSTHALLVCAQVMDQLRLPRRNVLAYTMPGFATSSQTLEQARNLMRALGVEARELDIRPASLQMLRDIDHPYAQGKAVHDITFENVQAGERTSHLFRLANLQHALVVGTSDLSELALGFCTYGVGDHMSHYGVNASVPKTLLRYVIRWVADTAQLGPEVATVLRRIAEMPSSPELVPAVVTPPSAHGERSEAEAELPALQNTELETGPYELQDFHLYYTLRFGFSPSKVAFLAWCAWHDRTRGAFPDLPSAEQHEYGIGQIKRHLRLFLDKFFGKSQFKRSCIPNAPKVGSGGSLSPRGDWRAPSDGVATPWLDELGSVPDAE